MAGGVAGWHHLRMSLPANIDQLSADELRRLLVEQDRELNWRQVKIDKLTHEVAYYKQPLLQRQDRAPAG